MDEKKVLKLFISQPINDKTDEEILAERERVIEKVKAEYPDDRIEVIDSYFQGAPHYAKPLWFLAKALEKLSEADVAIFASGWENYRGCKIEHTCAIEYGITVIESYSK